MASIRISTGTIEPLQTHFMPIAQIRAHRGWSATIIAETLPVLSLDTADLAYDTGADGTKTPSGGVVTLSLKVLMLIRDDLDACRNHGTIRHEKKHVRDDTRIFRSLARRLKGDIVFRSLLESSVNNTSTHQATLEDHAKVTYAGLVNRAATKHDSAAAYRKEFELMARRCVPAAGARTSEVRLLQKLLNAVSDGIVSGIFFRGDRLKVTGVFDAKTQKRVGEFRRVYGLGAGSAMDHATWNKLKHWESAI